MRRVSSRNVVPFELCSTTPLQNWNESEVLGPRRHALYTQAADGSDAIRPGKETEERYVTQALTTALSASQDSANALMLIVDYSLKRFGRDTDRKDWKKLGV